MKSDFVYNSVQLQFEVQHGINNTGGIPVVFSLQVCETLIWNVFCSSNLHDQFLALQCSECSASTGLFPIKTRTSVYKVVSLACNR